MGECYIHLRIPQVSGIIELYFYKDTIWCDVVTMDVGHIILGRPWLYDLDVTLYDRSNTCAFEFQGKKIKLVPRQPKDNPEVKEKVEKGKNVKNNKSKSLHIIRAKEQQEIKGEAIIFAVVSKEASFETTQLIPSEVEPILNEFKEIFFFVFT